jgi:hypothetical protein
MKQQCSMAVILFSLGSLQMAAALASPPPFDSCLDFHCDATRTVMLDAAHWQNVRTLFASETSPAGERERIRQAIALLEREVGVLTGTASDRARNIRGDGRQLDCISESKNTTTYLQLLFNDGLLRWHEINERQVRYPLIFDTHWTAVIRDHNSGQRYAVDSWFLDNGELPYIQPLQDWLSGRRIGH